MELFQIIEATLMLSIGLTMLASRLWWEDLTFPMNTTKIANEFLPGSSLGEEVRSAEVDEVHREQVTAVDCTELKLRLKELAARICCMAGSSLYWWTE
ncbi:hypothetical protein IT575_05185 [bacterium]|nr:hypothetical protein [bacterium]